MNWLKVMRRVLDLALIASTGTLLAVAIMGRGVPAMGWTTLIVRGPSMAPAIPVGAVLLAEPVDDRQLRTGDVVAVQVDPEHSIFTHRIAGIVVRDDGLWIQTKGDANATPDPVLTPATAVLGRVKFLVPVLGYLMALLSTLSGMIAVSGVLASLVVGRWLLATFETEAEPRPSARPVHAASR